MKCLPTSKLHLAQGRCLHDLHAEIVAIRAFNLYLLEQCENLASNIEFESEFLLRCTQEANQPPFAMKDDVRIHMYCSEAPCGDASMELTMDAQDDATPWPEGNEDVLLHGRGHFSSLGRVRRKPSRADAHPTLSKSCSDKLAMKQCTSLLSSVTSLLVDPGRAYLHQLVLPQSQHISSALERCFSLKGRLAPLAQEIQSNQSWQSGYECRLFATIKTSRDFAFSRKTAQVAGKAVGLNLASMWTPNRLEVLIGGTIQGYKQFAPRGASSICRANLWRSALNVATIVGSHVAEAALKQARYQDLKATALLLHRRKVKADVKKAALRGWVDNIGDESFAL